MNYFYDFVIGVCLGHSGCKIKNNQDIVSNEKFNYITWANVLQEVPNHLWVQH